MTNKIVFNPFLIVFCFLLVACTSNTYEDIIEIEEETTLTLKWNKAYGDDTLEKSIIGLRWTLSYMGATIPAATNGITSENNFIEIDLDKIGFTIEAIQKILQLHEVIKTSDEYSVTGAIDMGRYVTLLLGSAEHYYEITGVPNLLSEVLDKYELQLDMGYVNNSGVSFEHRIISFSEQNGFNQLFFCTERDRITNEILEYETVEILPNGQPRFGVFDANGFRKNSTDPLHSNAGKPAKCMWCHESGIQPLFSVQDDFEGFIPYLDFKDTLSNFNSSHRNLQNALIDGVNFEETQQHTFAEFLYILFMEPSAERLSLEWGISVSEVEDLLSSLSTHSQEEFLFFENLYFREEVEPFAPFNGLQVSSSVREQSEIEVNYIN